MLPVTHRQRSLAITVAAAALLAVPAASPVWAQGSAGTSRTPQTTQTTPQEGSLGGTAGGRAGANAGQGTTQTIPGNNAGAPAARGEASDRQVPPHMQGHGHTSTQGQGGGGSRESNPGSSVGPTQAPRDNAPGNPPSPNAPGRRSEAPAAPAGGDPPANSVAAGSGAGAPAGGGALAAVDSASMRDARRASRVIGAAVYNENNESVGEVDDIVLPANANAPVVAVVSVGGFLGIGAKLVAVPYERLRMNNERNRWTLTGAASRDDLNRLPTFSYDSTAGRG
jgi:sporulation protein YlmC with PRC-barrel domain